MTTNPSFTLVRDAFGQLVLSTDDGQQFSGVVPVRAFPIQTPNAGIALVSTDGHELAWIDELCDLPADLRSLIESELNTREFMPEIQSINRVSSYSAPCTWFVNTNRGPTEFVLRGDEDIRRLSAETLLISDTHGIHFLIRDRFELDKHSKKILDRFL